MNLAVPDDLATGPFRTTEAEPMAIEDIRDALVVRANGLFLLTDKHGNVPHGNESGFGLYRADTRYLSGYEFACTTAPLVMLLSTAGLGYASEQVLTNPSMTSIDGRMMPRETVEVRRQRLVDGALFETVRVTNFNAFPVRLDFEFRFAADFADIFQVRGKERRKQGQHLSPVCDERCVMLRYYSLDGRLETTRLEFDRTPDTLTPNTAVFKLELGPREQTAVGIAIRVHDGTDMPKPYASTKPADQGNQRAVAAEYRRWRSGCTEVLTSNEIFNAVLDQALNDVRTLWNADGQSSGFLAAGSPWFDTLFGRDSLIASLQLLAFTPEVARNTLIRLGSEQGTVVDEWRDEEPGKILHELRSGEMTRTGELPFGRYYGSIDSTPLYLVLAAEYWRWTGDLRLMRRLKPNLVACLEWAKRWGDRDGDGYLEYQREAAEGLLNQGWKDSGNAIVHRDGQLAMPTIALVEVQAYLYAGLMGLAEIADALHDTKLAGNARHQARSLRRRFNRDFWIPDSRFYALALDGKKKRVESIASNPGHALFAGIVPLERGPAVAARLMQGDMFTGWGIRTLSAGAATYNPMGYHIGSVWPHDNSLIAAGFKRYGQEPLLNDLASALYDTARSMEYYRLPELFCGLPRSVEGQPVPYPVACRPQAWAAGTIPMLLTSILGLCPNAPGGALSIVCPQLPGWLDRVDVRNLHVAGRSLNLRFELRNRRTHLTVVDSGGLNVGVVKRWPRQQRRAPL